MARMAKSDRAARRGRRDRGRDHSGWRVDGVHYSDRMVGPGVEVPSPADVFAALEQLPPELDWPTVSQRVVPLFERVRPYPPQMPARAQAIVPPGVTIGFGIDLGPGFVAVTPEMVEGWAMSVADLAAHAIARVHSLAAQIQPAQVTGGPVGDVEVSVLQTELGIGSVLVLAPSELARLFGAGPRLFIAPMRDLLVGLPPDVEAEFAAWLYHEIAHADPNCLGPRAFIFDGRGVTVDRLGRDRRDVLAG
jgi:hypothetical protein